MLEIPVVSKSLHVFKIRVDGSEILAPSQLAFDQTRVQMLKHVLPISNWILDFCLWPLLSYLPLKLTTLLQTQKPAQFPSKLIEN